MNVLMSENETQLIDFILTTHPAYSKLVELGKQQQKNIHNSALAVITRGVKRLIST